jgi:hypothetical protein
VVIGVIGGGQVEGVGHDRVSVRVRVEIASE